jgi:hypothetical protein
LKTAAPQGRPWLAWHVSPPAGAQGAAKLSGRSFASRLFLRYTAKKHENTTTVTISGVHRMQGPAPCLSWAQASLLLALHPKPQVPFPVSPPVVRRPTPHAPLQAIVAWLRPALRPRERKGLKRVGDAMSGIVPSYVAASGRGVKRLAQRPGVPALFQAVQANVSLTHVQSLKYGEVKFNGTFRNSDVIRRFGGLFTSQK